jgi:hypothetical protein
MNSLPRDTYEDIYWEAVIRCLGLFHQVDLESARDTVSRLREQLADEGTYSEKLATHQEPFYVAGEIVGNPTEFDDNARAVYARLISDLSHTLPEQPSPERRGDLQQHPGLTRGEAPLILDASRRAAVAHGREIALTRIEFRLLEILYQRRSYDVPLEQLLDFVWGTSEGLGTAELVRSHVRNLRQKLSYIGLPDAIRSHRGRGYALEVA